MRPRVAHPLVCLIREPFDIQSQLVPPSPRVPPRTSRTRVQGLLDAPSGFTLTWRMALLWNDTRPQVSTEGPRRDPEYPAASRCIDFILTWSTEGPRREPCPGSPPGSPPLEPRQPSS